MLEVELQDQARASILTCETFVSLRVVMPKVRLLDQARASDSHLSDQGDHIFEKLNSLSFL